MSGGVLLPNGQPSRMGIGIQLTATPFAQVSAVSVMTQNGAQVIAAGGMPIKLAIAAQVAATLANSDLTEHLVAIKAMRIADELLRAWDQEQLAQSQAEQMPQ